MQNDFISRATVLSDIEQTIENSGCANHEREIIDCVRYADAADVVPVIHAKWVRRANGVNDPECSVCGWAIPDDTDEGLQIRRGYCGHCGARMDGGERHAD